MSSKTDRLGKEEFRVYMIDKMTAAENQSNKWELPEADLKRALADSINLHNIFIRGAHLDGLHFDCMRIRDSTLNDSKFTNANLSGVNFADCDLERCDFTNANLTNTCFEHCELAAARFDNANLRDVDFHRACLIGASGIMAVTPVGKMGRTIYAYTHNGEIRIQAGCRNASPADLRKAIRRDYPEGSDGYHEYLDTVTLLAKWGKRELLCLAK